MTKKPHDQSSSARLANGRKAKIFTYTNGEVEVRFDEPYAMSDAIAPDADGQTSIKFMPSNPSGSAS